MAFWNKVKEGVGGAVDYARDKGGGALNPLQDLGRKAWDPVQGAWDRNANQGVRGFAGDVRGNPNYETARNLVLGQLFTGAIPGMPHIGKIPGLQNMSPEQLMGIANTLTPIIAAGQNRDKLNQAENMLKSVPSWKSFDEKSATQKNLETMSQLQGDKARGLSSNYQKQLPRLSQLDASGQAVRQSAMDGSLYGMTEAEKLRNNRMRTDALNFSGRGMDTLLSRRLSELAPNAGRGQAAAQLGIGFGGTRRQTGDIARGQADLQAAARALQMPRDRAALSLGTADATSRLNREAITRKMIMDSRLQNAPRLNMEREDRFNQGVNFRPDPSYGQAVLNRANAPDDLEAFLGWLNTMGGSTGGAVGGLLGKLLGQQQQGA